MKSLFVPSLALSVSLFLTASAHAGTITVLSRNGTVVIDRTVEWTPGSNAGQVTFDLFTEEAAAGRLRFKGYPSGILSINGEGNFEDVISDREMKAYGWCFSVDGTAPDTMADETPLPRGDERIVWYYAFAHYLSGKWISMCERDPPVAPGRTPTH